MGAQAVFGTVLLFIRFRAGMALFVSVYLVFLRSQHAIFTFLYAVQVQKFVACRMLTATVESVSCKPFFDWVVLLLIACCASWCTLMIEIAKTPLTTSLALSLCCAAIFCSDYFELCAP